MRYDKHSFANQSVELDGNEFYACEFKNCKLTYRGGQPPNIVDCSFNGFQINFEGCAATTLAFMSTLYHGGFKPIMEATFDNIRGNKPIKGGKGIIH